MFINTFWTQNFLDGEKRRLEAKEKKQKKKIRKKKKEEEEDIPYMIKKEGVGVSLEKVCFFFGKPLEQVKHNIMVNTTATYASPLKEHNVLEIVWPIISWSPLPD